MSSDAECTFISLRTPGADALNKDVDATITPTTLERQAQQPAKGRDVTRETVRPVIRTSS